MNANTDEWEIKEDCYAIKEIIARSNPIFQIIWHKVILLLVHLSTLNGGRSAPDDGFRAIDNWVDYITAVSIGGSLYGEMDLVRLFISYFDE